MFGLQACAVPPIHLCATQVGDGVILNKGPLSNPGRQQRYPYLRQTLDNLSEFCGRPLMVY